ADTAEAAIDAAEDALLPEAVVAGVTLAEDIVELTDGFEHEQPDEPRLRPHRVPERVPRGDDRVVGDRAPEEEEKERDDREEQLDAVPRRQRLARRQLVVARAALVLGRRHGPGVVVGPREPGLAVPVPGVSRVAHFFSLIVHDATTSLMVLAFCT